MAINSFSNTPIHKTDSMMIMRPTPHAGHVSLPEEQMPQRQAGASWSPKKALESPEEQGGNLKTGRVALRENSLGSTPIEISRCLQFLNRSSNVTSGLTQALTGRVSSEKETENASTTPPEAGLAHYYQTVIVSKKQASLAHYQTVVEEKRNSRAQAFEERGTSIFPLQQ